MELFQLRYFSALGRCRNYSKAAEELFIAQPTLSQQIKRLEDELGVRLFERSTRKVELTDAGKECLIQTQRILEDVEGLLRTAREKAGYSFISLGVLTVYPERDISDMLSAFQADHPEIELKLTFADSVQLVDMVQRGKLDAVIANISTDSLEKEALDRLYLDVF